MKAGPTAKMRASGPRARSKSRADQMKGNFAQINNMESKIESIQLTRICIPTTFPVGEKSIFFKKRSRKDFPLNGSCIVHI